MSKSKPNKREKAPQRGMEIIQRNPGLQEDVFVSVMGVCPERQDVLEEAILCTMGHKDGTPAKRVRGIQMSMRPVEWR